ncbi:MAG: hypothetical protein LUD68_11325, partial [Rikenellaceae bacterium]|nr:hypothetical protein [Rikenellaceae bacterium]
ENILSIDVADPVLKSEIDSRLTENFSHVKAGCLNYHTIHSGTVEWADPQETMVSQGTFRCEDARELIIHGMSCSLSMNKISLSNNFYRIVFDFTDYFKTLYPTEIIDRVEISRELGFSGRFLSAMED